MRNLTEHDVILVQRQQKEVLASPLRSAAALEESVINTLTLDEMRTALMIYRGEARHALEQSRMNGQ